MDWSFFQYDSKNRPFLTQTIEPFDNMTRIELFLECDSKNWTDSTNWTPFFLRDSQNWASFFLKRCFFPASWCITSTSAELLTCVVSTLAQSCVQHFSCYWMNSVDSVQDEFSRGLAFPECEYMSGVVSSTSARICEFLSCFHASPPVSICCDVFLLEPVDLVATSTLFSFVHPHCHCITSFIPLSKSWTLLLKWLQSRIEPFF